MKVDKNLECAYRYLGYKARTEKEISDYLLHKGIPRQLVLKTINRLKKSGYIDDSKFVYDYMQKKTEEKKGLLRIKNELQEKGIDGNKINSAIKKLKITDETQISLAEKALEKRLGKYFSTYNVKGLRKIGSYLISRGFEEQVVDRILEKYQVV